MKLECGKGKWVLKLVDIIFTLHFDIYQGDNIG
jgi:hypothetical protein